MNNFVKTINLFSQEYFGETLIEESSIDISPLELKIQTLEESITAMDSRVEFYDTFNLSLNIYKSLRDYDNVDIHNAVDKLMVETVEVLTNPNNKTNS